MPVLEHIPSVRTSGASFVVAASDSPDRMKRVADYVCDGTADDVQIQAAIDALPGEGGVVTLAPGTYNTTTTINLDDSGQRVHLTGYGARIVTSGAIWAITLTDVGAPISPNVISGLTIYQQGDADALGGIKMLGARRTHLRDLMFVADSTPTNFVACILSGQDTDSDGSYWSTIENCYIRKDTGGSGNIPVGIYLRDNANAIRVIGGGINNCTDGILCDGENELGIDLDSLTLLGVPFEGCTDAIELNGVTDTNGGSGIKIIGCRGESLTNFLHVNGRGTTGYVEAPFLAGNWTAATVTNYVTFTGTTGAGQDLTTLDESATNMKLYIPGGKLEIKDGASGVTPQGAENVQIEADGAATLAFYTPNTSNADIRFGDPEDPDTGRIRYDHSASPPHLLFYTDGGVKQQLNSTVAAFNVPLTITESVSGVTPPGSEGIQLHSDTNIVIAVYTSTSAVADIRFGDSDDPDAGRVRYDHNAKLMSLFVEGAAIVALDSALTTFNTPMRAVNKTDATRGAAGTAGRIIFNTDDGKLNIDDGTNWTLPDGTTT